MNNDSKQFRFEKLNMMRRQYIISSQIAFKKTNSYLEVKHAYNKN